MLFYFSIMRFIINLLFLVILTTPFKLTAQTTNQQSGWAALFYSQKFSDKIGMHFDFQVRSADDFEYLRNTLIRPGVTWFIDENKNATLGYALIINHQAGNAGGDLFESRIWEQFIYNQKIRKLSIAHRFRLEQRFIETSTEDVFSNRIRYFVRSVIPLKKQEDKFTFGLFAALQNEVFLNLQNKDKLNGHTFDQNRAYGALGYRINPKIDLEAGYLNQTSKGRVNNTTNHVVQFAVYTRF